MKIRHPLLIKVFAYLASVVVRLWIGTVRYQCRALGMPVEPTRPDVAGRYIYAFWHENILIPAYQYRVPSVRVLISQHADGELIAQTAQYLNLGVVRGSSTRGGAQAMRQMLRVADQCHFVITPDGPRGPRRQVQEGLIYLAARTGLPIVVVGIGMERPWRANSWDRMALPRPWRRARGVTSAPVSVPPDVGREQIAGYLQQVQATFDHVNELAEEWAETGVWPEERAQRAAA